MKGSQVPPEITQHREKVGLELRLKSWSYQAIGKHLNISTEGARQAVKRAQKRDMAERTDEINKWRLGLRRQLLRVFNLAMREAAYVGTFPYLDLSLRVLEDLAALDGIELRPKRKPMLTGNFKIPEHALRGADDASYGAGSRLHREFREIVDRSLKHFRQDGMALDGPGGEYDWEGDENIPEAL